MKLFQCILGLERKLLSDKFIHWKTQKKPFSIGRRVFTCSNKSEVSVSDNSYCKAIHVICHALVCISVEKSKVGADVIVFISN